MKGGFFVKIERIGENQIQFTLSASDLAERGLKETDLMHQTHKTQALLSEMMKQAVERCGFNTGVAPLIIEAMPGVSGSIVIIITRVTNQGNFKSPLEFIQKTVEERRAPRKRININQQKKQKPTAAVYKFQTLDDFIEACQRLEPCARANAVYKNEDGFYLVINCENIKPEETGLFSVLSEYGAKQPTGSHLYQDYIAERGEVFVRDNAINTMIKNFGTCKL